MIGLNSTRVKHERSIENDHHFHRFENAVKYIFRSRYVSVCEKWDAKFRLWFFFAYIQKNELRKSHNFFVFFSHSWKEFLGYTDSNLCSSTSHWMLVLLLLQQQWNRTYAMECWARSWIRERASEWVSARNRDLDFETWLHVVAVVHSRYLCAFVLLFFFFYRKNVFRTGISHTHRKIAHILYELVHSLVGPRSFADTSFFRFMLADKIS